MMREVCNFWKKVTEKPVRLISLIVILVFLWLDAGWIFHPIHSVVSVAVSVVVIIAVSVCVAQMGYLQKIDWYNNLSQKVATKCTISLAVLVILFKVWGYRHTVLFTIIAAVIFVVALKDILIDMLSK